jgi:hypothetical protein
MHGGALFTHIKRNGVPFLLCSGTWASIRKLKAKPQTKIFHATMLVTRAEEWWVEAETIEEAQALLASGQGHHATLGERVHIELDEMLAEEV